MTKIFLIAKNSAREAFRQKLVSLILAAAVALTLFSMWAMKLDLGHEQLKFTANFTAGALGFFGAVVSVVLTCRLFYSEIENRTAATLLARPVSRFQFVAGKLAGVAAMLAIFALAVLLAGAIPLFLTRQKLGLLPDEMFLGGRPDLKWAGYAVFGFLQYVKLVAIAAMACLVCAASRSMVFAIIASFMVCAAAVVSCSEFFSGGGFLLNAALYIVPDFDIFENSIGFIFGGVNWAQFFAAFFYGVIYIFAFLILSVWAFASREI
ncbi:MAG: ABC transporter permease subunit [Opitutales bacterium]|nr:ABC transporter permease subunit [Opitutales bacterium]